MSVAEGLAEVRARIAAACARAGRDPGSVELIAVSKLQPEALIQQAHEAGHRAFGENYAQELRDKSQHLAALQGVRWHFIGPLQANKAKYVARAAHVFHAVDRLEIAEELSKRRQGAPLDVLVQIWSGEESKSGASPEEAPALIERVRALPQLRVVGLMAMPPLSEDPERVRPHFRALRALAERLGLAQLSMGTTADYEVAVEEGATMVRVGTAIFGARVRSP
jgi:pyridoxal phosphate enzyme (YggS family)